MVTPGAIIRFNDYKFENGESKPKYAIVLYSIDTERYIYTLTTSDKKLRFVAEQKGCHTYKGEDIYSRFKYYHFPAGAIIGKDNSFYFDDRTYVNFYNNVVVGSYQKLATLCQNNRGIPLAIILDSIDKDELDRLRKCLINSTLIPRDILELIGNNGSAGIA